MDLLKRLGLTDKIEIHCPCCNRHRHIKEADLPLFKAQNYVSPNNFDKYPERCIVCPECWVIIQYFLKESK